MLAFIVGIAVALQGVGLKDAIVGVFDDVATVLAGGKSNYYAEHFSGYHTKTRSELKEIDNKERVDMDLSALQNIADGLIGKDLKWLVDNFPTGKDEEFSKQLALGNGSYDFKLAQSIYDEYNYETTHQLGAIRDGDSASSSYYKDNPAVLSLIHGSDYNNSAYQLNVDGNGTWSKEGYFYSDGMIGDNGTTGKVTSNVYVRVATSEDGKKITGAHVWVKGGKQDNIKNDTGTDGKSTLFKGVSSGTLKQ